MTQKNSKKKATKYSKTEFKGLDKYVNLKTRRDLIDFDYVDKLSPEEKEFLNKFSKEYNGASFKKNKNGKYAGNLQKTIRLA